MRGAGSAAAGLRCVTTPHREGPEAPRSLHGPHGFGVRRTIRGAAEAQRRALVRRLYPASGLIVPRCSGGARSQNGSWTISTACIVTSEQNEE